MKNHPITGRHRGMHGAKGSDWMVGEYSPAPCFKYEPPLPHDLNGIWEDNFSLVAVVAPNPKPSMQLHSVEQLGILAPGNSFPCLNMHQHLWNAKSLHPQPMTRTQYVHSRIHALRKQKTLSGLLLRNLKQVTILGKPYYLLYIYIYPLW